jgi:NAD-dependent dihydropyrimidine dehydrogenase PreA subunit
MSPKVDQEKCTGCGTCADVCPRVFEILNEKSEVVHPIYCFACWTCVELCPERAITLIDD